MTSISRVRNLFCQQKTEVYFSSSNILCWKRSTTHLFTGWVRILNTKRRRCGTEGSSLRNFRRKDSYQSSERSEFFATSKYLNPRTRWARLTHWYFLATGQSSLRRSQSD